MRKLFLFLVMFGIVGILKADENDGIMGGWGGQKIWKTSETASNDNWVMIATGNIMIGFVNVSSRGYATEIKFEQVYSTVDWKIHGDSWCYTYGSTVPANGVWGFPTNAIGSPYGDMIYVMQQSTTGWKYNTSGGTPAKLRILWDYVTNPKR
jgi:hypothetical protein